MNPPDLHRNPFSNFPLICEKVQSKNISVVSRSGFIHVTGHLLTCRKLCLAFHRVSTCRHPAGHSEGSSCRVVIIYSLHLQGLGRGGQSRHTTPSERTNARARPSRVSSAPFSEQRPRFGSTERARSLTKTPARRQISDPRFPEGGEKKTSGNLARGSYASTPRRVTAGTAERGTMAEPNPAETGEVKTLWVGDLVSAPSRRASSCPARQPPIFWFQPGSFSRSDG